MEFTKYEIARLIGARALQLSAGAPPMLKTATESTCLEIAKMELDKGIIPLIVLKGRAR